MYLNMVLARLLRNKTSHVSIVQGGFRALHQFLLDAKRLRLLDGHVESKCTECTPSGSSSWVILESLNQLFWNLEYCWENEGGSHFQVRICQGKDEHLSALAFY